MTVQYTSQKSYEENGQVLKKIGEMVYDLILNADKTEGISNREIAKELGVETATISGLTRPLVKNRMVKELKKRECKVSGHTVIAWVATENLPRDLFGNLT